MNFEIYEVWDFRKNKKSRGEGEEWNERQKK